MSIYDRLKNDSNRFLAGDDMQEVTLYNASDVPKTARARVTDVGMQITPNGQMTNTKKYSIAFNIDAFSDITGADEDYKNWQAEFLNSQGETVKGRFNNAHIDKTLDYVVANLIIKKRTA